RCKSGTISGRNRSNGYTPKPKPKPKPKKTALPISERSTVFSKWTASQPVRAFLLHLPWYY
ncbi:hypothetical protein, partial [Pseudomonas kilonensis]|uniref:hypothetical protein n=1 Tax=Pseudomonas kilonensis TaxID=132476 RepID=UPI001C8F8E24